MHQRQCCASTNRLDRDQLLISTCHCEWLTHVTIGADTEDNFCVQQSSATKMLSTVPVFNMENLAFLTNGSDVDLEKCQSEPERSKCCRRSNQSPKMSLTSNSRTISMCMLLDVDSTRQCFPRKSSTWVCVRQGKQSE